MINNLAFATQSAISSYKRVDNDKASNDAAKSAQNGAVAPSVDKSNEAEKARPVIEISDEAMQLSETGSIDAMGGTLSTEAAAIGSTVNMLV